MPNWVINWRIEGAVEVVAPTAESAQDIFDRRWGSPGFCRISDGEVTNDKPAPVDGCRARKKEPSRAE